MPEYRAKPGEEDRHGEMTGAITINLVFVCALLTLWCICVAPFLPLSDRAQQWLAAAVAVVLTLGFLKPSQWIWSRISAFMDRDDFLTRNR